MDFGLSVSSSTKRAPKTNVPELSTTPTLNKLRLNEAASSLLGIVHGNSVFVISTEESIRAYALAEGITGAELETLLSEHIAYYISKSVPMVKNGAEVVGRKPLTNEDRAALEADTYEGEVDVDGVPVEVKYHGAKVAASNKSVASGQILEFSDSKHYPLFGGNADNNVVWELAKTGVQEAITIEGEEVTLELYPITKSRTDAKLERKSASDSQETVDPDVNAED